MADISKIKLPDGVTYNIKDATARGYVTGVKGNAESSYRTGNVNLTAANVQAIPINTAGNTQNLRRPSYLRGPNDVTLDGKVNTLRANRLAFLPADQIIIEKTTDGGVTWSDAGVSDANKTALFSETRPTVNLPLLNGVKDFRCGLRITISAMKYNVPEGTAETDKYSYWNSTYVKSTERYNQLKEMYFWVTVQYDSLGIKVERATGAEPNTWVTAFDNSAFLMTGWSGNDYLSFGQAVFGGSTTQTTNYWNWRITFFTKGTPASNGETLSASYTTYAQTIFEIRAYGDTWWTAGNEYAANDKMYSHDYQKNVTFPARVTASGFTGDVIGASKAVSYAENRPASANTSYHDAKARFYLASTSMTTGKPPYDARIIHLPWDNTGWDAQIALSSADDGSSTSNSPRMWIRSQNQTTWGDWQEVYTSHILKGTSPIDFNVNGTISHANSGVTAASKGDASNQTPDFGSTFKVPSGTVNATGHLTAFADHTVTIPDTKASTSGYGITQLSTSTSSTATNVAATPSAVKTAYDLANSANGTANTALSGVNGTLIYDHTYTITNGVATFTPHVYLKGEEVTTNYNKSCFTWKYRLDDHVTGTPTYVNLTTNNDRGCTVTISTLGYGGHVIGTFTPPSS